MSQNKQIFIIGGGEIGDLEFLRSQIEEHVPAAIICADSGARHAYSLGLTPTMIVGDMDSLPAGLREHFKEQGCAIRPFSPDKDDTDMALAFEEAAALNPSEIRVFGALGFRLDHTLANLSLLLKGRERQITVRLLDEWCEIFLVTGTCTISGKAGQTVSLLPFYGEAGGISLTGFRYPLNRGTMTMERPLGISNRLISESGTIAVASGQLIAIRFFREDVFPT
ncbi:MAG: thiamine diphosphokinase [Syntrophales bacterium]|nr:thiamine diphosphokinase [Syntrophales bacterium]